jgi:hypothetical protein
LKNLNFFYPLILDIIFRDALDSSYLFFSYKNLGLSGIIKEPANAIAPNDHPKI